MDGNIRDEVCDLMMQLSRSLWSLQQPLLAKHEAGMSLARLIAPRRQVLSNGYQRRISEQEARIVLCHMLDQKESSFSYYSVETPTNGKYQFKGKTELSARTDMTLYSDDEKRLVDIEFKKGNPPEPSIDKDIWKLLKEGRDSAWFHILKNADAQTFSLLFKKIRGSFSKRVKHASGNRRTLWFVLCVLAPTDSARRVAYYNSIRLGDPTADCEEDVARLFSESMLRPEDGWHQVYPENR
ncbi:MAG: hypothetical protein ACLQBA_27045 [Candidatus Binataceae bacterium]